MSIERKRTLDGYILWTVYDGEFELVAFNSYHDAVHFIRFIEGVE